MGSKKSMLATASAAGFVSAREADRRIAGVAAAGRSIRALADAGSTEIRLRIGDGAPLAPATIEDIERLRGPARVALEAGPVAASEALPSSWALIRATGKASDGPVSRWLNRPISRRLSLLSLRLPGVRPFHATIATALLALAMFAALIFGGNPGLVLGGLLFHAASVVDGVDGEIARATFRASATGAMLDSAVDLATNIAFIFGLTVSLAMRDGPYIAWVGGWGLGLFLAGLLLLAWRVRGSRAAFQLNLLKERYKSRFGSGLAGRLIEAGTIVTSRDFFALLFALMILAGAERAILYIFAAAASVWILFVLGLVFFARRAEGPVTAEIPQCSAGA